METFAITKVKNGAIILPKKIQGSWKGANVYIDINRDIISIKKLSKPKIGFKNMLSEFSSAAKKTKLSKKEIDKTLKELRQK